MTPEEALDNLGAAYEARDAALGRAVDSINKQFEFIIKLREREYQEALERERVRNCASGKL